MNVQNRRFRFFIAPFVIKKIGNKKSCLYFGSIFVGSFILIPIAPDLKDNKEIRNKYLNIVLKRIEDIAGEKISENIIYKKSFCVNDFISEYNSYKGNAYGLANTLFQTSIFKPKIKSKKIKGLYFTGQLTVPGPGVPPSLISGKIVSKTIMQDFPNQ